MSVTQERAESWLTTTNSSLTYRLCQASACRDIIGYNKNALKR